MIELVKPDTEEHILIQAIRNGGNGRTKGVQKIIDDHQGFIHKLKLDTGLGDDTLRDIYTDTVLLILQHIEDHTFKGDSKLSTYFFRVFYFKSVDFLRKQMASKIEYTDELPDHNDASQDFTNQMEIKDEMSQIIRLLDQMCAICRQIIMDWAYWGFKPNEIGERIGEKNPVKYSKLKYNCVDQFKKLWAKRMAAM